MIENLIVTGLSMQAPPVISRIKHIFKEKGWDLSSLQGRTIEQVKSCIKRHPRWPFDSVAQVLRRETPLPERDHGADQYRRAIFREKPSQASLILDARRL